MSTEATLNRLLNQHLTRVREAISICKGNQKVRPFDHDNNDNLAALEDARDEYLDALERVQAEFEPVHHVILRLRTIADQCEAGGHKSRARMFRAVATELEVTYL